MAQQAKGHFGYQTIQLLKTECLGIGSYGAVFKAMCDDLPCAGKILHPTLFQTNDPGEMTVMRRFQQECSFLSAMRHPNIVQYLGSCQDPETRLPVLLMELMDESLTQFLERSQEPLPYHTQVNICHDIALALAYLHSNGIVHRDLSSNNVLLLAGNRAKVTDFGMAKLFNVDHVTMTPLTMCPGTQPYMSPEALDDPPVYTEKLDSFSFGVLDIQIVTRQFPDPGPRIKIIRDPWSPTGKKYIPVLETERRKSHIDLIDSTHPLLPIATDCLSYNEKDRPSAQELCHYLATLKEAPQYSDSVQQAQERSRPAQSPTVDRQTQIGELQGEGGEQHQSQVSAGQSQPSCQHQLIQELEEATQKSHYLVKAGERQLQELQQCLVASEQVALQFQQNLQQREKIIHELQEQCYNTCRFVKVQDLVIENTPDARIDTGSFGDVLKGTQSGSPCAVKVLHGMNLFFPFHGNVKSEKLEKFEIECQFLKQLKHPNIVEYLQMYIHSESGNPLLAMELMDENLSNFLEHCSNSSMLCAMVKKCVSWEICKDVAAALSYLHSPPNVIVHRDLSSNNILLSGTTETVNCQCICAKVSDFGISRLIDKDRFEKTLSTLAPGTKGYMLSWRCAGKYNEKFDIFSFGVLMVQTITMLPPNPSDRVDSSCRIVPELKRRKDHLQQIEGHPFQDLVLRCLQDEQDKRPTAAEICRSLLSIHGHIPCNCS